MSGALVTVTPIEDTKLTSVRVLWRQNSGTLGFLPDGAFEDHARRGWLLGAYNEAGVLLGYVLYRLSGRAVVIVHLCVAREYRSQGVCRILVNALKMATSDCLGIRATCRADFAANAVWPKLNFVVTHERPARQQDRLLKTWWYDYGHPDLFSIDTRDLPTAAIDANVFFDLLHPEGPSSRESQGLLVGWFQDLTQLAVTAEIYNEIDRRSDAGERLRARQHVQTFRLLRPSPIIFESCLAKLRPLLGPSIKPSDESDRRHLGGSIAAGARYFVTRDTRVLELTDEIFRETGITVLRPSELLGLTDEELNAAAYQPARLGGVHLSLRRARAGDIEDLVDRFLAYDVGEKRSSLLAQTREACSSPEVTHLLRVDSEGAAPVALIIHDSTRPDVFRVPLFRVRGSPAEETLAEHLIWHALRESVRLRKMSFEIDDVHLAPRIATILSRLHFRHVGKAYVKQNLRGFHRLEDMEKTLLIGDGPDHRQFGGYAPAEANRARIRRQLLLERALWPGKALDSSLPTYIVPIRPYWAMQLFDEDSSREDLFGADPLLLLRTENVYYRAARPRSPSAPARALWYVSDEPGFSRAKHLVACSLVNETFVGEAKQLFKRFQRLGVFTWSEILAVARNRATGTILSFSFSHTELFPKPIPWRELKRYLRANGLSGTTLQSPLRVTDELFRQLYEQAV